ncbi:substrate-binding domain-containing protein [Pseudonocardia nantongensis]|uniref:substrate-binding domain-containing protein n=1 Tax=Pseudonocardia nantongensis TaxID=1181885 RepID=UPI00397A70F2
MRSHRPPRHSVSVRSDPEGTVVAPHESSCTAGTSMLERGGNAVDAAVAAALVAGVVEPTETTLGGSGFLLHHTGSGDSWSVEFGPRAPLRASSTMFDVDTDAASSPILGLAPLLRVADNDEGRLSAIEVAEGLLTRPGPPDAIITSSSVFAVGTLAAAQRLGIGVPDELMIATATDGPVAELSRPSITGLGIDVTASANRLVDLLSERMGADTDPPARELLPLDLILRESTRRCPDEAAPDPR